MRNPCQSSFTVCGQAGRTQKPDRRVCNAGKREKTACPVGYKVYASNGKIVYEPFKAYTVRKDAADALNIRKGPGTNYDVQGQITDTKRYTVVEESAGVGSAKGWGRLKAGGWVALDWVKKAQRPMIKHNKA